MNKNNSIINKKQNYSLDAFSNIYNSYNNKIYNFAYKMFGNKTMVFDITREIFIQVYKNHISFKAENILLKWIYEIAENICYKFFKKVKRNSLENLINKNAYKINFIKI